MRSMLSLLLFATSLHAAEPANTWKKTDAVIEGRRWDVPLGYDPVSKRFLVLGGRTDWANYKKPRPYDVLAFDPAGKWLNELPNAEWGPASGLVNAPPWKSEYWGFTDAAGNTRPNWTIYGTFSLGQKYAYDPDSKVFWFYAGGSTFKYDPASKQWTDMKPANHPEKELGGILLWSSLCYDTDAKKLVLFGGGNIQSQRGDPGTWTYTPSENKWEQLKLESQPPARANSRLVYDPVNRKCVLFGGDRLNELVADVWTFGLRNGWVVYLPPIVPQPRAGHAMLWLPRAQKVLLLGGYSYTSTTEYVAPLYKALPLEAWTYDVAKEEWQLVARWDKDGPSGPNNFFHSAAVSENDDVLMLDSQNRAWTISIDVSKPTPKPAAKTATTLRRTSSHDPAWYKDVPAADPDKLAAELKDLPANKWTIRPTPKRPLMNMDWGSAVFDTANDRILRFSGGHSAYSGTAPFIYDIKTDRYSLPFAPEYPIEYVYSNDQVHGEWSFGGNPWMTGHTYKSTGYDVNLKSLVFAPHDYTYLFDAVSEKWSRSPGKNPYRPSFYTATVVSTPSGAIVWGDDRATNKPGLWKLDSESKSWKPLPLKGPLPDKSADQHGLAHDTKRDRLLFFSDNGPKAGNVVSYDMKTGEAKWLDPPALAKIHCRETVYIPEADLVLIGARIKEGDSWRWVAFDCAANAWCTLALAGDDPVGKAGSFNNSMGLMYDPSRRLIWAVGQHSHVHVLKLDASGKVPLK